MDEVLNGTEDNDFIALQLWGESLDPDEISRLLGINPSFSRKRGYEIGKSGKKYERPYGQWSLHSCVSGDSDIERHVEMLKEKVQPKESVLRGILETCNANLKIGIQPDRNCCNWSCYFKHENIKWFVLMGIDICINVWRWGSEESPYEG